jgi:Family of unknown function (DUF6508)
MERLKALARFLPELERPGFTAGEMRGGDEIEPNVFSMPFASHGDVVHSLVEAAYQHGWVLKDFDWPEWAQSDEAARLRDDQKAIDIASEEQLARLLTVCIRQDRFVEGALLHAFESGLILRIVRRAAALVDGSVAPPPA